MMMLANLCEIFFEKRNEKAFLMIMPAAAGYHFFIYYQIQKIFVMLKKKFREVDHDYNEVKWSFFFFLNTCGQTRK